MSTSRFFQMPIYQGRWPQIKKCLKQTWFKIQFFIGIQPSKNFFWHFFVTVPYSRNDVVSESYLADLTDVTLVSDANVDDEDDEYDEDDKDDEDEEDDED